MVLLGTIMEEKEDPGKTQLLAIYDTVAERYNRYLSNFDMVGAISDSPFLAADQKEARDALISCYESRTKTFKTVRGRIFKNQPKAILTYCPYCLLNVPKTLDHYIGKRQFPEFSILCKNLIPSCWDCNKKKDEKWRLNGRRRIIHFYNDTFLAHRFLRARLIYPANGNIPAIEYYLERPPEMTVAEFQLVEWHFEDLELLSKYNERANTTFSVEYENGRKANEAQVPRATIQTMLMNDYTGHAEKVCPNFYQAVMYETLANDPTFLAALGP